MSLDWFKENSNVEADFELSIYKTFPSLQFIDGPGAKYSTVAIDGFGDDYHLTTDVITKSSTKGSSKYFKINVDDNGTITATEVT